ncbi:hypothetical protein FA13DRAFT_1791209 [Coprinellus micaceus]|uniref:Uncharacterized protein n=1 Tax=Coprinellus micaceus TaxID=71717 RepID=A0A4Y7TCL8_COPMI|nr:hypothetical protein FA13DRAFT_1791209 [Coprinellus micaceus]
MPEAPEVYYFYLKLLRLIAELTDPITGENPYAQLLLLPRCFAIGTAARSYDTISHDKSEFDQALEPPDPEYSSERNEFDIRSAKENHCLSLVNRPLKRGPLHAAVRGKCLVIAAGHHAVSFNFGLEACLYVLPIDYFYDILTGDRPGPNPDKAKARCMQSFKLPRYLIEETRRSEDKSTDGHIINIFCSFLTERHAIIVSDFSRLVRLHVTSLSRFWTAADLKVRSHHWKYTLFVAFPDGPDWVSERPNAYAALDRYRDKVLDGTVTSPKFMVDAIGSNSTMAFGGFGHHLANDFLHFVLIHPLLSPYTVCSDEAMWGRLRGHIATYMAQWQSNTYIEHCCQSGNSRNPFAFNATQERNCHTGYVAVHTKKMVRIYKDQYNQLASLGLFDPDHTIGEAYQADPSALIISKAHVKRSYRDVEVIMWEQVSSNAHKPLRAFSVIHANPLAGSAGWVKSSSLQSVGWKDLWTKGVVTTIGTASFGEMMGNKPDAEKEREKIVTRGRPRKAECTGLPGCPCKTNITIEKRLQVPKGLFKRARSESVDACGDEEEPQSNSNAPRMTRAATKRAKLGM